MFWDILSNQLFSKNYVRYCSIFSLNIFIEISKESSLKFDNVKLKKYITKNGKKIVKEILNHKEMGKNDFPILNLNHCII